MVKTMRNSSLYIAIEDTEANLGEKVRSNISNVFSEIFGKSFAVVSDVADVGVVEIVYAVRTPVVNDNGLVQEFYENLEVLLEELEEYSPHFTQFKGEC